MSKTYPVTGLKETMDFLSVLPERMQRNAIRQGLTAAAAPVRDEARVLAGKASGKMARAIKTGSPRRNQDGTFSVQVRLDPKAPDAYLGIFQEYGVAAHLIARTGGGEGRVAVGLAAEGKGTIKGRVMKIGEDFVSGIIHHPGHAAHPFMRPALDAKVEEALAAFGVKIRDFIESKTGFAPTIESAD